MEKRSSGYLANVLNVPPLIFRFQFNPELLSEKKSYEYREANDFGKWEFEKTKASKGLASKIAGALDDLKDFGPLLVATKAQSAVGGKPRTFSLDFALDARARPGLPDAVTGTPILPDDPRMGGRIEPALAVLRSFMNPGFDPISDLLSIIGGAQFCGPIRPPTCDLKLGAIDLTCVMNDLNIKVTHFKRDTTPLRAEVSITLTEQTQSIATTLDYIGRAVEVVKSYWQLDEEDVVQALPGAGLVQNIFELGKQT
jgi:hypothetical protein